jgi:hypothetical protein
MSTVRKATEGYEAIGIISTAPGVRLGGTLENGVPVAFTGRVPVKVTDENGTIKRGDYITVSPTRKGYGMKLVGEGRSIGIALSDDTTRGSVLVLLQVGNHKLDLEGKYASTTNMLTTGNVDLNANGVAIVNIKAISSANGSWSIDADGRVTAKQFCLDDVCIDKGSLRELLDKNGLSGTSASSTATTTDTTSANGSSTGSNGTTTDTTSSTSTDATATTTTDTSTSTSTDLTSTTTPDTTATTTDPSVNTTTSTTDTTSTSGTPVVDTTTPPPADTLVPTDASGALPDGVFDGTGFITP